MKRSKYIALRKKLYKVAGEVGSIAEGLNEKHPLSFAYRRIYDALNSVDLLGEHLNIIDPETNQLIDKRRKKESL